MQQPIWSEFHRQAPRMSVAVGAVVQREDQVLFVRQMYGGLKGQWGLPTGFVDLGERPEVTALREVHEEAGIEASVDGLLSVTLVDWEGDPQIYVAFLCRHLDGEPVPDGKENDRAAYFSLAAMDVFDEPFERLCAWMARRVLHGECHVLKPRDASSLGAHYLTLYT